MQINKLSKANAKTRIFIMTEVESFSCGHFQAFKFCPMLCRYVIQNSTAQQERPSWHTSTHSQPMPSLQCGDLRMSEKCKKQLKTHLE